MEIGKYHVEITNEDKVLFPESGITKGQMVEYYRSITEFMLPHIKDRPVTMHRFPNGISQSGFIQKSISEHFPEWMPRATVEKEQGEITMVLVEKAADLVYLAQQGMITPHVWLSRVDKPEKPDRLIFDLDPSKVGFQSVRLAALLFRELVEEMELVPFVMTTGSRGMHVTIPLDRTIDFDTVREFSLDLARVLEHRFPDKFTTERSKAKRGARLYLDIARNAYAQTGVAPYGVRAKPNAPVATPLHWDEVNDPDLVPDRYTIETIFERLNAGGDPWAEIGKHAKAITKARQKCADELANASA